VHFVVVEGSCLQPSKSVDCLLAYSRLAAYRLPITRDTFELQRLDANRRIEKTPMQRLIVKSRVGGDGVLRVIVPVGEADADQEVQLTIEPLSAPVQSHQEYLDFLQATAGAWQGDFERPEQGEYEERDPL
jgi:hypothetical protein